MDKGSRGGMEGGGCRSEAQPSDPKEAVAGGALLGALPVVRPGHADAAVEQVVGGGRVAVVGGPVPVDSPQLTGRHCQKAVWLPGHHGGKLRAQFNSLVFKHTQLSWRDFKNSFPKRAHFIHDFSKDSQI